MCFYMFLRNFVPKLRNSAFHFFDGDLTIGNRLFKLLLLILRDVKFLLAVGLVAVFLLLAVRGVTVGGGVGGVRPW